MEVETIHHSCQIVSMTTSMFCSLAFLDWTIQKSEEGEKEKEIEKETDKKRGKKKLREGERKKKLKEKGRERKR